MAWKNSLERETGTELRNRGRWLLANERMYLNHALRNHGKKVHLVGAPVDGVMILENWLKTYKIRVWDFYGVEALYELAHMNLLTLKAKIANGVGSRGKKVV